jgi:hypothetical protein
VSPILAENKDRYPADWAAISDRIRFGRAGGRCECRGECGLEHDADGCRAPHGQRVRWSVLLPGMWTRARGPLGRDFTAPVKIVLTTGHLDHQPEHCTDQNLRAWCQRCHNRYDRSHRNATRKRRQREAIEAAGQLSLSEAERQG